MCEEFLDQLETVTRVDVICDFKRVRQLNGVKFVAMVLQDDNRTMKLFLVSRDDNGKSVEEYHANLARSFQQQDFAGPVDATLHVETGEEPEESLASQLAEEELTLKEKLVAARKAAGMSKADITKALGWKEKEVSRFERLDSNPTLAQIRYYAHAIGALVTFGVENGKGVGG